MRMIPFLLGVGLLGVAFVAWALIYLSPMLPDYSVPEGVEVFDVAEGMWASDGAACEDQPQAITFSPDRSQMLITWMDKAPDPTGTRKRRATYDIIDYSGGHIRGAIVGETRTTDAGDPVVWDLVLRSEDVFTWHRTDWPDYSYTADLERCPEAAAEALPPPI
jgi:hypothetical protein